jgi:hypothetical protein
MSAHYDGGPAFPISDQRAPDGTGIMQGSPGMSLRDWFAGMALQGLIANPVLYSNIDRVERAYSFADAMLAERLE